MAQWPDIVLTGVLLCSPKGKSAVDQNVQGRCQDGHIHSSAGVAVRGEKERDVIQESPVGLRTTSPWAQGRNGFLDGGTAWAKAQALTVQAGTQSVRADQAKVGGDLTAGEEMRVLKALLPAQSRSLDKRCGSGVLIQDKARSL